MRGVVRVESWPIRGGFRIARGARDAAEVVVAELHDQGHVGRAECVPYTRYGESTPDVCRAIEEACRELDPADVAERFAELPAGAARNALDCALWDLNAKRYGRPAWSLCGLGSPPAKVATMRTVSVDSPERMRQAARCVGAVGQIKVKVDGGDDLARIAAVRDAAPDAKLIVDANEAWSIGQTRAWLPALCELGVVVLEQPVPAQEDAALGSFAHDIPICADESFHDRGSWPTIHGRYDMINIKLDKAGGLTEALACRRDALRRGVPFMIGCMVSTSLAVEPALLLTEGAAHVDLDGPLLLEADREGAQHDVAAGVLCPSPSIWGGA